MATHAFPGLHAGLARWVLTGTIAGALSMLVFHQGVAAALHAWALAPEAPKAMWPLLLWGSVWGAALAGTFGRLDGLPLVAAATGFGAVLPTLVALVVWAPLKGQPPVTGIVPLAILLGVVLNAAWGLGTGLGLALFGRARE